MTIMDMSFPVGEARARLVVRNTFLDLAAVEQPRCRGSASLPPSLRLAGGRGSDSEAARCPGTTPRRAAGKAAFDDASSDASGSCDVGSTASGGSVAVETSTDAGLYEPSVSSDLDLGGAAGEWPAVWPAVSPAGCRAEACDECAPPAMTHVALNPRARAWTPGAIQTLDPAELTTQMVQVHGIASAVEAALAGVPGVLRTRVLRLQCGWSVAAEVPAHIMLQRRESVLRRAKEALLAASEHSSSIYVLGYKQTPFLADGLGFSATLCDVRDTTAVCWGYLESGSCKFQGRCKWQHPWCQTMISVAVLPSEPWPEVAVVG